MLNLRRKATSNQITTEQCREMIMDKFCQLGKEHLINEQQEQLDLNYANALKRDYLKEETIKDQLVHQFFTIHKNRKRKYYLQEKLNFNENQDFEIRKRLSKEFKRSITGSKEYRNRNIRTPSTSNRYERSVTPTLQHRMSYTPSLENRSSVYSSQIDNIIEEAHRVYTKPSRFKRNVLTATDRKKLVELTDHNQKQEIIDKIIENDVDDYLKFQSIPSTQSNPEEKKKLFEETKMKQLTNFDKYNMSFVHYMRQKTHNNIEKSIYNEKIRQKQTYVEKFQKFILTEFKFSEEAKRRLEKVFKSIELEYKRPTRNKQLSERIPKK